MMTSRFDTENGMAMAMIRLAQRWCGASTPVNMLHADDMKLFRPLNSSAPQAAHMFYELRSLGYSLVMGWVNEPYAAGDATIYGVLLTAAGESKGPKDSELVDMQRWRRDNKTSQGVGGFMFNSSSSWALANLARGGRVCVFNSSSSPSAHHQGFVYCRGLS